MRFLTNNEIVSVLNRQYSVEHYLPNLSNNKQISWLEIRPCTNFRQFNKVELWHFYMENIGSNNYLDIYSFPYMDSFLDQPIHVGYFNDIITIANSIAGNTAEWLNAGMIQEQYKNQFFTNKI